MKTDQTAQIYHAEAHFKLNSFLFFRNVAFFAGSILAVLVVLTVIDEDVLNVEHVFTIATIAGKSCQLLFLLFWLY